MASSNANELVLDSLLGEVRDYIDRIQRPSISDGHWKERVREAGDELAGKIAKLAAEKQAATSESLRALADRMRAYTAALAESPNVQALKEKHEKLARSYEEFLVELEKRQVARAAALASSRQLKPVNYVRNGFHAMNATISVLLYHFVLSHQGAMLVLGSLTAFFGTLEILRRFSVPFNDFLMDKVFGAVSRPSERYRVNSATLYLLALFIITAVFPKMAVEAAILVLGYSDPMASLIGKRFGKRKLYLDKSLAGTLAFFVTAFLAVGTLLVLALPELGALRILGTTGLIALVGAVTELVSTRIDDNFTIPMACAAAGALLL